jgi:hypothetical protein
LPCVSAGSQSGPITGANAGGGLEAWGGAEEPLQGPKTPNRRRQGLSPPHISLPSWLEKTGEESEAKGRTKYSREGKEDGRGRERLRLEKRGEGGSGRKKKEGWKARLSRNAPGSAEFTFQVGMAGIVFGA